MVGADPGSFLRKTELTPERRSRGLRSDHVIVGESLAEAARDPRDPELQHIARSRTASKRMAAGSIPAGGATPGGSRLRVASGSFVSHIGGEGRLGSSAWSEVPCA